jgi:ribosomal protein S18 acetylase RimI-like enzyme
MIRTTSADDLPGLKRIVDRTGLFPSAMLDEMIAAHLSETDGGEIWLTHDDGGPRGLLYCAPERMTEGAWNILLIAVDPALQGRGVGSALIEAVEAVLNERGARIVLVETSGLPDFEPTRRFYRARGYSEEARIRDYYRHGDDKVVFWKALGGGG